MYKMTKKVGPTGRFGPRYGKRIREAVLKIEKKQRQKHVCPKCKMKKVKRVAMGIYECKKCGVKFASGAYYPEGA